MRPHLTVCYLYGISVRAVRVCVMAAYTIIVIVDARCGAYREVSQHAASSTPAANAFHINAQFLGATCANSLGRH